MSIWDWLVLCGTLAFIAVYGIWKTRGSKNIEGYLMGDKSSKWWGICLSIMATQASAITFLSIPGQAYADGMGFIQIYFGLPIAMVIISITAVPLYAKLKVYTAYEYLESRFDVKTRTFAALLFLVSRGLATGITIYAPSIILSAILGWNLNLTTIVICGVVVIYTVSGGTKAVSVTQQQQMAVAMGGMLVALIVIVYKLYDDISLVDSVKVAGKLGKMNLVDFSLDLSNRYNFWSGILGGLFLSLSYFGTDQSQVARYISGESVTESRLGLLFNGLLKIPMQFFILFIGVMVFVFYQYHQPPAFFNKNELELAKQSPYAPQIKQLEEKGHQLFEEKNKETRLMVKSFRKYDDQAVEESKERLQLLSKEEAAVKKQVTETIGKANPDAELKDTDYIFLTFIMEEMPIGLVGLLIAVIFCAAMSSTSSQLNALASSTCVDIYKRSIYSNGSERHYLNASRLFTILWGFLILLFAIVAAQLENLIQAINILGSLFYGTILGIFLAAFYVSYIKSRAVFIAAIVAELTVLACFFATNIGYLWYNVIGCGMVIVVGLLVEVVSNRNKVV